MENAYEWYADKKDESRKLYNSIGRVWCPTLGDYIAFSKDGFQHLMRKNGRLRPRSEQKRRFELILYARDMLQDPHTQFVCERRTLDGRDIDFWKALVDIENRHITIIVYQRENGMKHFLSIYGKNRKSAL